MANYTVAQSGDTDDAANINALSGIENNADFVADGLNLTNVNHTDNTFDLTEGEVFILVDSMYADRAGEDRFNCLVNSHFDTGITTLSFTDGTINHVYARANLGVDDAPKIDVLQDESNATDDSFRIAVIDDTQSISYEVNRDPDAIFEKLEADDVVIRNSLTANGLVDTEALSDYAVTAAKIADNAVTHRAMEDDSVDTAELQNDSVTTSEISDDSVTTAAIAAGAVTSSLIASGAVGTSELEDGSVETSKVAEDAITKSLIGSGAVDTEQLRADSIRPEQVEESERFQMDGLTSTEPVAIEHSSPTTNPVGASRGENIRMGGNSSDSLFNVQGGGGRVAWTWNAEYRGGEWKYIESNEFASAIRMNNGAIHMWTADGGSSGDVIQWESTMVNNGRVGDSHNLGGVGPDQYARLDQTRTFTRSQNFDAPIELLNHDSIGNNTAHDIIWRNQPSGEEIHAHYQRPYWHLFDHTNGRYNSMLKVDKDGDIHVQGGLDMRGGNIVDSDYLELSGGNTDAAPPNVGCRLYYYNNRLFAVNDAGVTIEITSF